MAKRRMISDDQMYSDEFLKLSFESKVLYFYSLIETDADGIFNGVNKLLLNTQAKEEHLKELLDNNFLIQDSDNPTFAITDFHIMNRMDKNRRISHKKCSQWLKVIALEQAEQYAANLLNKGIDNDTVAQITGLTYGVVQLIANNCIA